MSPRPLSRSLRLEETLRRDPYEASARRAAEWSRLVARDACGPKAHERGFRLNKIEMAAALGALIDSGKAEILPPPGQITRNARREGRYAAV